VGARCLPVPPKRARAPLGSDVVSIGGGAQVWRAAQKCGFARAFFLHE